MATLYVAEFGGAYSPRDSLGGGQVSEMAPTPPANQQTIAIGGASIASAAFGATTAFIRVHTDVICSIAFGAAPVATATSMRLAADQTEYFTVSGGSKIAVISNT